MLHGTSSPVGVKATDIKVGDIEHWDVKCPYCDGGKWAFVQCGCGGLSCAGGVKEDKHGHLHYCPWCQSKGYLGREIEEVSGKTIEREQMTVGKEAKGLLPPDIRGLVDNRPR